MANPWLKWLIAPRIQMMIFFCTISAKRGLVGYLFFCKSEVSMSLVINLDEAEIWLFIRRSKNGWLFHWHPVFEVDKNFVKSILYPLFYCSPGIFKFLQIDFKPIELFFNQNGPHWTGLDQTGTDRNRLEQNGTDRNRTELTGTDQNRPKQIGTDKNRPEQTRTDWNRPDRTTLNRTGPDRNRQKQTGTDRNRVEQTGPDQTGLDQTGTSDNNNPLSI